MGELFSERAERSSIGELISVTINQGVVKAAELDRKDSSSSDKSNYKKVKVGDIAYNSMRMWQGASGYSLYSGILSPAYTVIFPRERQNIIFWSYKLKTNAMLYKFRVNSQGLTSDTWNLKYPLFSKIRVSSPKLDEQTKIASLLSTLDTLITLRQRKLELLRQLKKAMLQQMFPDKGESTPQLRFNGFNDTWKQRKLGDFTDSYSGGTPSVGNKQYYNGQIPFIRSAEINSENTELSLTIEGLENSSAKLVNKGDILYALYGATSGEVGRARLSGAINQAILAIKIHAGYDSEFIVQWLQKNKHSIVDTYLQGGQGNLSASIIKNLFVDFPSFKEQQQIGIFFQQLDNLITLHQRKLERIEQLKKFLLQRMFV